MELNGNVQGKWLNGTISAKTRASDFMRCYPPIPSRSKEKHRRPVASFDLLLDETVRLLK